MKIGNNKTIHGKKEKKSHHKSIKCLCLCVHCAVIQNKKKIQGKFYKMTQHQRKIEIAIPKPIAYTTTAY